MNDAPTPIIDRVSIFGESEVLPSKQTGFFINKTANQWLEDAKKRPTPEMLCGELWYQGEVCILFGDSNCGKSILAVQICDALSRGDFGIMATLNNKAEAHKVLYCDFELTDKQFQTRYSNELGEVYEFSDNFRRLEINPDMEPPEGMSYEELVVVELEQEILRTDARTVVIDNITFLQHDNTQAKDAVPLMKALKELKNRHDLSLLALAHTPKRNPAFPLGQNDVAGSKMLMNFCDSAIAIGRSIQGESLRYLKQIKARNTAIIYGGDNVVTCNLKQENKFLGFRFVEYLDEGQHLKGMDHSKDSENALIWEMHKDGKNNVEIASMIGCTEGTIRNRLKKLQKERT